MVPEVRNCFSASVGSGTSENSVAVAAASQSVSVYPFDHSRHFHHSDSFLEFFEVPFGFTTKIQRLRLLEKVSVSGIKLSQGSCSHAYLFSISRHRS